MTQHHRSFAFFMVASSLTFFGCAASADPANAGQEGQALASDEAGAAGAASKPQRGPGRGRPHRDPEAFLKRLDVNQNGVVEVAELPQRAQRLASADANADGKLTADELRAHGQQKHRARFEQKDANRDGALSADEVGARWERLAVADANADGKVTLAELEQARAAGKLGHRGPGGKGHGKRGAPPSPEKLLQKFDANRDGVLESSELPERKRERWMTADQNKDGRLSAPELTTFFEQLKKVSGARRGGPAGAAPRAQ